MYIRGSNTIVFHFFLIGCSVWLPSQCSCLAGRHGTGSGERPSRVVALWPSVRQHDPCPVILVRALEEGQSNGFTSGIESPALTTDVAIKCPTGNSYTTGNDCTVIRTDTEFKYVACAVRI